jgi:hypothetical protein
MEAKPMQPQRADSGSQRLVSRRASVSGAPQPSVHLWRLDAANPEAVP